MKNILIAIIIFFPAFCFAQEMKIVGRIPQSNGEKLYRIQVGAFRQTANAEKALNDLRDVGLNPVYENYMDYRRVVLTGINARDIPLILSKIRNSGFNEAWVREEQATSSFSIVVSGGVVNEIIHSNNTEPLTIVQTIPSFRGSSESSANTYQANAPLVFFFNDKIYLGSIEENIEITADRRPVNGTIIINEGYNGFAVLTLTPDTPLPEDKEISITLRKELQDAGGNHMLEDLHLAYIAEKGSETNFNRDNFGFESENDGIVFTGDGKSSVTRGPLHPFEGNYYAAISTGNYIVSDTGVAIGSTSSHIQLGPIMEPFSSLSFYYNFISSEFNDYVGSVFDDTAMVTIYGPRGTHSKIITSVNRIGFNNKAFAGYPGMPDDGDLYAGHTEWQHYSIENVNVGNPAFIIFTVTDVGDDVYSSILAIDAIDLK